MKKLVIAVIVTAMFGWAVYDMIDSRQMTTSEDSPATGEASPNEDTGLSKGQLAPDFTLERLNGETVSLSDYRGEKVMLNFWATWCPPCRAEMPDMERIHQEKDVTILAVNLTDTENKREDVRDFAEDFELTFPIVMDEQAEVKEMYQIRPVPTSIFIDEEGRLQAIVRGAMNYDMMIQRFNAL
ncbi:redoxin domain-containing protein [Halobacillus locisalis]|uniref:Redoxin domain-containing protein n=1 Tax=Halobacillus locisalis TaxID=220753 RepID=A0A838CUP8_9BACI|nr:redoxin domain-containing protein [Halobacillus locisalis]MBA2175336.1 redoxin domain-containing protein [Halobacillus locisalis]